MTRLTYFDCGPSPKLVGFRDYLLLAISENKEAWATCICRPDKLEAFAMCRLGTSIYGQGHWESDSARPDYHVPGCIRPDLLAYLRGQPAAML